MQRDTAIFDLIKKERERQTKGIELIASENFVFLAPLTTNYTGSITKIIFVCT